MRLMRWEPFRDVDEVFKGLGPLLARMPMSGRAAEGLHEFMPPADIVEREKEYLIKVDLPDVPKEHVKVFFEGGMLTIKGERKVEKETKGETVRRTERYFGTFERTFALPEDVETKAIRAESKEGVLTIFLPRVVAEKTRPLAITIQ